VGVLLLRKAWRKKPWREMNMAKKKDDGINLANLTLKL